MSWLDGFMHRVRTILRPEAYASELDEEMRHHLDLDAMQQGDADRARRAFGNRTRAGEDSRDQTWLRWTDILRQDLGTAWRGLWRSPAATALAVGTLALGIGATAATFAVVDRLFLRAPDGVAEPSQMRRWYVQLFNTGDGQPHVSMAFAYPMYQAAAEASGDPASVAAFVTNFAMHLGRGVDGPRVRVAAATANYFDVLGVRMALGRAPTAAEDRMGDASLVAVISHDFWRSQFGQAADVLGKPLQLGPLQYTIIGVTAPGFAGLDLQAVDVWMPLAASEPFYKQDASMWTGARMWGLQLVQRWPESASLPDVEQRATQRMREVLTQIRQRTDSTTRVYVGALVGGATDSHVPLAWGQELVIATRLAGVSGIVLLIALANVVNILLARATQRRREIAVRLALGMSSTRLARVLAIESVLLAMLAAIGAAAIAWSAGTALRGLLMPDITWRDHALDWRVAMFTLVVSLVSGLIAGLIPASQARQAAVHHAIKSGAGTGTLRRSRVRSGLVLAQAALSVTLLIGASLFLQSLRNVEALDIGYDAERLLFGRVAFEAGMAPGRAQAAAASRDVASRLTGRPGILGVARANFEPMQGIGFHKFYTERDSSGSWPGLEPTSADVSPTFFDVVGMRLLSGRTFSGGDLDGAPAEIVVNEAMARSVWPGENALGQCVRFDARTNPCYTVVGIVETARQSYLIEPTPQPQYYLPLGNLPEAGGPGRTIIVRTERNVMPAARAALESELRRAFPAGSPRLTTMVQNLEPGYRPWRLGATLFSALGVLALVVALVGVYGTVSYTVGQRTREFGVRMALGARVGGLLRQVVTEELRVIGVGVVVGIGLALAAGRVLSALLYGVEPGNPVVLASVAVGVLAAAVIATLRPAWRATQVDPVGVLREE